MTADSSTPPPERPELGAVMLALVAKIAVDHAELLATVKRIEAAAVKPAGRAAAPSVEALSERILSSLTNPYTAGSDRSWTSWGRLQRDFPELTEWRRRKLSEYWKRHAIAETCQGRGVRIIGNGRAD